MKMDGANENKKSKAPLVLGILGIIFGLLLPPVGGLLGLIGTIIGAKKHDKTGLILGIIAMVISVIRIIVPMLMAAAA